MVIKGVVDKLIYRNNDNGYCVFVVDGGANLGSVTAVGSLPDITEGTSVELTGEFTKNVKFGEQFSVTSVVICLPTAVESIAKYLASGLFKGVGEITADNIVEKFGKDTFDIIVNAPAKLAKVKGVGSKKAMEIHDAFLDMQEMQDVILYLQNLNISLNLSIKIFKQYGKATKRIIEVNPYQLVDDVDGIGFLTGDNIAKTMGVAFDSNFRINAGITYILKTVAMNDGHTYLPKGELFYHVCRLLSISEDTLDEKFGECITTLEVSGKIVTLEGEDDTLIMFYKNYEIEQKIASKLITLHTRAKDINVDIVGDISEYERLNGITLHDNQKDAIVNAIASGVNVITGGPGTGKTTIIKAIIAIFDTLGLKVQLCAPTGRAAKRLYESTGIEAMTIHRLLDLDFKDGKGYFTFNEDTQLECDVVIIDEVSMCDEYVFNALISAIPRGGRLIMVGDKDQLPSVGAGNVLADIIGSRLVSVSYLTHIYRQAEESLIVANAHRINHGEMPIIRNANSDFLFENTQDSEQIRDTVISLVTTRIPNYMKVSPREIQVLAPLKKGAAGVTNLNIELQNAINPPEFGKRETKRGDTLYREGDKIIHVINDYELEWTKDNETGTGVFNGDMGYIVEIDRDNGVKIEFEDGRVANYSHEMLDEIKLAYAISVHKAQGSEFPIVVLALCSGSGKILTRNLLYTAVTRAKNTSVLVGNIEMLRKMVDNNFTAKRYTLLKEFITEEAGRQGLL